jgi:hypothetical protein
MVQVVARQHARRVTQRLVICLCDILAGLQIPTDHQLYLCPQQFMQVGLCLLSVGRKFLLVGRKFPLVDPKFLLVGRKFLLRIEHLGIHLNLLVFLHTSQEDLQTQTEQQCSRVGKVEERGKVQNVVAGET